MVRGESGDASTVSDELQTSVDTLSEPELRALVDYGRRRLRELHEPVSTSIEPRPGEEFVEVVDRGPYTEVVKREPCVDGCSECPHGPFVYHVSEEPHPDDTRHLHWSYIGPVVEHE